jgi:hypothetical protein
MFEKIMLNKMKKEAEKICTEVLKTVPNSCKDSALLFRTACNIIDINPNRLTIEQQNTLNDRCICIEGVCYMIGLEFGTVLSSNALVLRCIQFIGMIDEYLYSNGVEPCSLEQKIRLLKIFNLYDAYRENKKLFKFDKNKSMIESDSDIQKKIELKKLINTSVDPLILSAVEAVASGKKIDAETRKIVLEKIRENPTLYREIFVKVTGNTQFATKDEQEKWLK